MPPGVEGDRTPFQHEFQSGNTRRFTPLAGAVLCGSPELVEAVIKAYGKKPSLTREEVGVCLLFDVTVRVHSSSERVEIITMVLVTIVRVGKLGLGMVST